MLESLQSLQQELGDNLHPLALDVTDAEAVKQVASAIPVDLRDIAVVVNMPDTMSADGGCSRKVAPSNGVTSSTPICRA